MKVSVSMANASQRVRTKKHAGVGNLCAILDILQPVRFLCIQSGLFQGHLSSPHRGQDPLRLLRLLLGARCWRLRASLHIVVRIIRMSSLLRDFYGLREGVCHQVVPRGNVLAEWRTRFGGEYLRGRRNWREYVGHSEGGQVQG